MAGGAVLVLAGLLGLFGAGPRSVGAGPAPTEERAGFDGARAFTHLQAQCEFGPRVPGTDAHERCQAYLKRELSRWADEVREQKFRAEVQSGSIELTNLIAVFHPPTGDKPAATWAMVCAHWDSRPTADNETDPARRAQPIPGANDGASGAAVVLELARTLAAKRPPVGVMLVLFDGEDYGPDVDHMLLGARHFAKEYRGPKIDWAVLLDMIGERDLRIPIEGYSQRMAPAVVKRIWNVARARGSSVFVDRKSGYIGDDHLPLLRAGIPCIVLIDFDYPYWHTLADTPDKCAPESLQAVGDVLVAALMGGRG